MAKVIETTVYEFSELGDAAKEKARDWYREGFDYDSYYAECPLSDFAEICKRLGIEIDRDERNNRDKVWWSGFCSQGDGASYEGRYSYAKGAARAVREYAPKDERLHAIADDLAALQRPHFYGVTVNIGQNGYYQHSHTMQFDVHSEHGDVDAELEQGLAEALRGLADWLYRQLESAWDYENSDEAVDENIALNEYTFTECGARFG